MSISTWLSSAILVGVVIAGSACTQEPVDATTGSPVVAAEQRNAGTGTGVVGAGTKDVASTTGEVITDTWITARVSARFVEETLLQGDDINVDTTDHAVTLKGTVRSHVAKARAAAIAGGTEGVSRVVNQLVVK
jgi:hyperosmotically inducible periplasmic protein